MSVARPTTTPKAASRKAYRFDRLLVGGVWQRDRVVELDEAGLIQAIGPAGPDPGAAEHIAGWALPGLHNVHSHAFQRGMVGLAERGGRGSFWGWRDVMYAFLRELTPDDVEAVAAQLYVELLKGGFTCVGEFHYLHHAPGGRPYDDRAEMSRRILRAARATGIGLVHIPVVYLSAGFGGEPLGPEQERFRLDAEGVGELVSAVLPDVEAGGGVSLGWGVHSLRACPPDEWARATEVFRANPDRPVHLHVSEQPKEVTEALAHLGARPIEWILDHADVGASWCLVHGTHASPDELGRMAGAGAVVGLCPATEANLGDGIFPLPGYLAAGGVFAVGTDSHVTTGAAGELRLLEYGQRLVSGTRGVIPPAPPFSPDAGTGAALLGRALAGGAQALGRPGGDLGPGAAADIVVLDPDHPSLVARNEDTVLDSWVFADHGNPVRDVMVGGRWVVRDGRHEREAEILARYASAMKRVQARV